MLWMSSQLHSIHISICYYLILKCCTSVIHIVRQKMPSVNIYFIFSNVTPTSFSWNVFLPLSEKNAYLKFYSWTNWEWHMDVNWRNHFINRTDIIERIVICIIPTQFFFLYRRGSIVVGIRVAHLFSFLCCVVFVWGFCVFCLSSSCVPIVASVSGLSLRFL